MMKQYLYKNLLLAVSLITCFCITGCGTASQAPESDYIVSDSPAHTTESSVAEAQTSGNTSAEASTDNEAQTQTTPVATLIAFSADVEDLVWLENDIDIRYPEQASMTPSWNQTLPIALWGKKDIIASIQAPLTLEHIKGAGYEVITADGSTAALISNGKASSDIIGYLSDNARTIDYTVASLDAETLFNHKTPGLQHVTQVLGTPDFGFAYNTLEARYYYLYENYYLEVSFYKEDSSDTAWKISEMLYFDASSFLNKDFSQEISRVKESGIKGFSSDYLIPTGF